MNMQGIFEPVAIDGSRSEETRLNRVRRWLWQRRAFGFVVVLPSLLLAGYLFLIASDQYESEAHFLVRSTQNAPQVATGMSQAISMVTGATTSQSEAMSVSDYLTSHDAVDTLRREDRLVERFHRSDVDFLSRLRQANPTPERLLKYYQRQVRVTFNTETGITTLKVHSFRPEDSYDLVRKLLTLGEQRVNILNVRSYSDAILNARRQFSEAENALVGVQSQLTRFRQVRRDVDPEASGKAQIGLVTSLTEQLAAARAQLEAMGRMINRASPQYRATAARVRALEVQVATESGRLTGGANAIANDVSDYQTLLLRQQFLGKRYEAASASLDRAREMALRQQLYLVRVVDANKPVKSMFPERWRILATAVIALLLTYSIGWLIVAGVREHAA